MKTFDGITALITGGSSGIGLALACQLAAEGAHIWLLARTLDRLEAACNEVSKARRSASQQVLMVQADVADETGLAAALQPLLQSHSVPDLVINSAGISHPGFFEDVEIEHHRQNMEVNYFGTLNTIHAVLPGMLKRGSGHIVNISSIAGFHGILGYSAYSPSKFAVRGLSDVLLYELKPRGIQVSVVFPPDTLTPQLENENKIKPPLLKILSESNNKALPADVVARSILRDVRRNRYLIAPGFDAVLLYTVNSLPWNLPYRVMDLMLDDARRKLAKHQVRK